MMVAAAAGAGVRHTGDVGAGSIGRWTSLGNVEALGLLAFNYGGSNAELAAATRNFERRDLEFGRLHRVAVDIITVMHSFFIPSFVVSLSAFDLIL